MTGDSLFLPGSHHTQCVIRIPRTPTQIVKGVLTGQELYLHAYRVEFWNAWEGARLWWMGGWKHLTCSTGRFSGSLAFRYLESTEKIWVFSTWKRRILSHIFFSCCWYRNFINRKFNSC